MIGALPTFVIIGAMKSGTSALYVALRPHPEVFLHPRKEVHFFDERWDAGIERYAAPFADRGDAKAWGEATPDYMRRAAVCAPRAAATVPDARLIAILRDPADRAYSHYWHQRGRGREPLSFEAAIDAELSGKRQLGGRMGFGYVDGSRYASQLDEYLLHFPREQLLVLVFEQFTAAPEQPLKRVLEHIGVTPDVPGPIAKEPVNKFRAPRSIRLRRLLDGRGGPVVKLVDALNTRSGPYPPMRPETRTRLTELLAAERASLTGRYGLETPEWDR